VNVPCEGADCPLCKLIGEPTAVMTPVREEGSEEWKWLSISRKKVDELGVIQNHNLKVPEPRT